MGVLGRRPRVRVCLAFAPVGEADFPLPPGEAGLSVAQSSTTLDVPRTDRPDAPCRRGGARKSTLGLHNVLAVVIYVSTSTGDGEWSNVNAMACNTVRGREREWRQRWQRCDRSPSTVTNHRPAAGAEPAWWTHTRR